jgi:hypothetical protein
VTAATRSAGVLAVAFLLLHLPFLPPSVEDVDSVNFVGVRDFDVTRHQYIHLVTRCICWQETRTWSCPTRKRTPRLLVCGALAVFALVHCSADRAERHPEDSVAIGVGLTLTAPLFWFTAVRPLSDMPGLAASLLQALILSASTPHVDGGGVCPALAAGIRSVPVAG